MKKHKYHLSQKEFDKIYSRVPRACVEIIIKTSNGVLLTLRKVKTYYGLWHFPGATLYYKETVSDAINRVAKEELGIEVNVKKLLGYNEYPSEQKKRGFGWSVGLVFLCSIKAGILKTDSQAKRVGFFKKLPKNIVPEHKSFLGDKLGLK